MLIEEPIEQIEANEPTLPMLSTEPVLAMLNSDPELAMLHREESPRPVSRHLVTDASLGASVGRLTLSDRTARRTPANLGRKFHLGKESP